MQNGFVWRNQIIPNLNNQILPVFGPVAIPSDILTPKAHIRVEKMRVGNNPGIETDFKRVAGDHPLIIFGDFRFLYQELVREQPGGVFLAGRSRRVLRGNSVKRLGKFI